MRQLSSLDAQFLAVEDARNLGHVAALSIYEPVAAPGAVLCREVVRDLVARRLHLIAPFRWRLRTVPFGLDTAYWVEDPDFDLDFHVRELALPAPGDDGRLAEQVARIHARPLDRSRPLWELYVIQGLSDGRVAIFTKMHHALVDGVSGQELLAILLDPSPEGRDVPPPPVGAAPPRPIPGELEMLGRGLAGLPRQPIRALRALPRALPYLDEVATLRTVPGVRPLATLARQVPGLAPRRDGGLLERPDVRAPRTSLNGRISAHRRLAFGTLSLAEVKALKTELKVTVNDVVVALCAGALRRWLADRCELPAEPLLAMIPMSVRAPDEQGTFGNRVSAMVVPLPTHEPDPVQRVRRAHEALRPAKERHRALPATLLQDANELTPPALLTRAARVTTWLAAQDPIEPVANVVISNVPGSPSTLFCAGARQLATYPVSAILDGVGLNITVLSYRNGLDFGIVADRDQVDDARPLLAALRDELDTLLAAAGIEAVAVGERPAERV